LASFGKEDGAGGSRTTTYLQAAHPALRERYRSAPPSDGGNSASSSPSPSGTSVDEISTAWTTNQVQHVFWPYTRELWSAAAGCRIQRQADSSQGSMLPL